MLGPRYIVSDPIYIAEEGNSFVVLDVSLATQSSRVQEPASFLTLASSGTQQCFLKRAIKRNWVAFGCKP